MVSTEADEQRRVGLRRMKALALSLLILAAVVYLATLRLDHSGVWGYVNTGAEAAMVGALADWFAVTALFRYPMGLKIPHTAIVPTRKDEIGRNLQDFFTDNFLTEEIARERVSAADIGRRVGTWVREPEHAERAMVEGVRIARAGLSRVRDEEIREFVVDGLLPRLANEPISPIAGDLLDGIIRDGAHSGLVDLVFGEVHGWLGENPRKFAAVVGERAPWWTPPWADERIINWTYQQALQWVSEIRDDVSHPTRRALDDLLLRVAADLQGDPDVQERAEALKARLLTHPQIGDTVESLWHSVRASLLSAMDDRDSQLWTRGQAMLQEIGDKLLTDDELRLRLEARLGDIVSFFINTYGHELAGVITHTIERWDGKEASERIELHVGRDLQFIRINGTVVGALAGLVIHTISQLIG
ncbi:MAG: DUF445 domain-containing protein [Micrococcales bacterium]|nr:DUF445 domain-containing protein [Micrococcales bacterium]